MRNQLWFGRCSWCSMISKLNYTTDKLSSLQRNTTQLLSIVTINVSQAYFITNSLWPLGTLGVNGHKTGLREKLTLNFWFLNVWLPLKALLKLKLRISSRLILLNDAYPQHNFWAWIAVIDAHPWYYEIKETSVILVQVTMILLILSDMYSFPWVTQFCSCI